MAEAWPALLRPIAVGFWFENPSRGGGPSIDGREQIVASMAMRWRASLLVPIRTNPQVLAARAFFGKLQGRAVSAAVPVFDGQRAPWPISSQGKVLHPGYTRRKQLDDTIYEDPEIPSTSAINATVSSTHSAGVTEIAVSITQGGVPQAGQYFGIGERLYLITAVAGASSPYDLTFLPPLRAQATNGTAVIFTRPLCTMKQVADDQGLKALELLRFADLTLEFREDL